MEELKNAYRRAVWIWMGMGVSIFVYAMIVEIIRRYPDLMGKIPPISMAAANTLRCVLFFFTFAEFFLIGFIRDQILSGTPNPETRADSNIPNVSRILNGSILAHALCETVAVYGLVLFLLTQNPFDFYLFLLISLIYFLFYFPRYDQWIKAVGKSETQEGLGTSLGG